MLYVVIGILAMIAVGGGVAFFVMRAAGTSSPASPEAGDPTPAGDTPQHAEGDADSSGGSGEPISGPEPGGRGQAQEPDDPAGGRYKRDPVGGEGEGETAIDVGEAPHPRR